MHRMHNMHRCCSLRIVIHYMTYFTSILIICANGGNLRAIGLLVFLKLAKKGFLKGLPIPLNSTQLKHSILSLLFALYSHHKQHSPPFICKTTNRFLFLPRCTDIKKRKGPRVEVACWSMVT